MKDFSSLPIATTFLISIIIIIFVICKFSVKKIIFGWATLKKDNILIKHEYWRLVTASFLHTGYIHVIANIVGIYWAGLLLEEKIGSFGVIFVFLIANVIANSIFTYLYTFDMSYGASPGIYALVAIVLVFCFVDNNFLNMHRNTWTLDSLLIYAILGNIKGLDTLFIHLIGFISGIVLGVIWCAL